MAPGRRQMLNEIVRGWTASELGAHLCRTEYTVDAKGRVHKTNLAMHALSSAARDNPASRK